MVDALGNPLAFLLTAGQVHDLAGADEFLPQIKANTLLADKAFDADERVIEPLLATGKIPVIPPKNSRKTQRPFDNELYKARHLIENFFCKLKLYRAIATRYDKTARNFLAGIHLAADADNEYAMIDSTIVRAHQHSAGAKKKPARTRRSGVRAAG